MARVKPTEVRLVSNLLAHPADSADDLAEQIIKELDDKRAKETQWSVVYYDPNTQALIAYGPYGTEGAAERALKGLVSPGPLPASGAIRKLRSVASP